MTNCVDGGDESGIDGGPQEHECRCKNRKTGSACEIPFCPDSLSQYSLGQLFFGADKRIQDDSAGYGSMSLAEQAEADDYLRDLVFVFLDRNGDGTITKAELVRNC